MDGMRGVQEVLRGRMREFRRLMDVDACLHGWDGLTLSLS